MDAFDHHNLTVQFDFPLYLRGQKPFAGRNFARFQRAAKCSGQSTGRRGHYIIQGCRLGLMDIGIDPVMLGNLGMHAEKHRFFDLW